jgi:lipopolysaccharide transport system permease protein
MTEEIGNANDARATDVPVTSIEATRGRIPLNLHELWEFRDLAVFILWRDVRTAYRQTAFGALWMILTPIVTVIISTVISSTVAKLPSEAVPYPLFNMAGTLAWGFFSSCLLGGSGSLLGYKDLISKVYFPRLIIPIVGVLKALLDLLIVSVILLAMMRYYGYGIGWNVLSVPLYLLLAAVSGVGVGLWLAPWVVHFRDVHQIVFYGLRVWMYATPIVYSASMIPDKWQLLYHLNPMANVVEGFRWALLGTARPPLLMVLLSFGVVMFLMISGAYHFRRADRSIVDIS